MSVEAVICAALLIFALGILVGYLSRGGKSDDDGGVLERVDHNVRNLHAILTTCNADAKAVRSLLENEMKEEDDGEDEEDADELSKRMEAAATAKRLGLLPEQYILSDVLNYTDEAVAEIAELLEKERVKEVENRRVAYLEDVKLAMTVKSVEIGSVLKDKMPAAECSSPASKAEVKSAPAAPKVEEKVVAPAPKVEEKKAETTPSVAAPKEDSRDYCTMKGRVVTNEANAWVPFTVSPALLEVGKTYDFKVVKFEEVNKRKRAYYKTKEDGTSLNWLWMDNLEITS